LLSRSDPAPHPCMTPLGEVTVLSARLYASVCIAINGKQFDAFPKHLPPPRCPTPLSPRGDGLSSSLSRITESLQSVG
jgi:hypothetical protein